VKLMNAVVSFALSGVVGLFGCGGTEDVPAPAEEKPATSLEVRTASGELVSSEVFPEHPIVHATVDSGDDANTVKALTGNCPSSLVGVTQPGSCYCPPMTSFGSVWGTGVYTNDSHLCTAAVHSGIISASTGGTVSYTLLPGRSAYCGSTRNGVSSSSYGSWSTSYSVGGEELPMVAREWVSHTYSARHISSNTTFQYTRNSSCLASPVSVVYVSDNDGDLLAVGADGARQVIDGAWLPVWDSYSPISTTRTACASVCPSN
jgi:hypothetical protein